MVNQILEISWSELSGPLEAHRRGHSGAVPDVQGLINLHGRYIALMQERTMLSQGADKVRSLLRDLLGEVFAFTNQVAIPLLPLYSRRPGVRSLA